MALCEGFRQPLGLDAVQEQRNLVRTVLRQIHGLTHSSPASASARLTTSKWGISSFQTRRPLARMSLAAH